MGVFTPLRSRLGGTASPTANEPVRQAPEEPRLRPIPSTATGLKESLQRVYALRPPKETFAEEAIKLIAKAAGVSAAALLSYESRRDMLVLLAATGLEADALHLLSGEHAHQTWDIPLRSLRSRRISVIESAHENPFVPKPIVALSPRRLTIATLPIVQANAPIGAIALFSPRQRGFPDHMLHALAQALRICAVALTELPSTQDLAAAEGKERPQEQPTLLRGIATLKAELARLTQALEEAERLRAAEAAERVTAQSFLRAEKDRVAQLERELAELRQERERLSPLQAQSQALQRQLEETRAAAESAEARSKQLEAALKEAERASQASAATVRTLESLRDELEHRLDESQTASKEQQKAIAELERRLANLSREAALVDELRGRLAKAERARGETQDALEQSRAEQSRLHEQHRKTSEELERTLALLKTTQGQEQALREQLSRSQETASKLEARFQELKDIDARLQGASAERAELEKQLDLAREKLERDARERASSEQAAAARISLLEGERDALRKDIELSRSRMDESAARLQQQLEASERARAELAGRLGELTQAESERTRLQLRVEEMESELTAARERAAGLDSRVQELGEVSSRLIAERRELHARIEALSAGEQTLEKEKEAAINTAQQRVTELESALARMAKSLDAARKAADEEANRLRGEGERQLEIVRSELLGAQEKLRQELAVAQAELERQRRVVSDVTAQRDELRMHQEQLDRQRNELEGRLGTVSAEVEEVQRVREESEKRIAALEKELRIANGAREALQAEVRRLQEEMLAEATTKLADSESIRAGLEDALERERRERSDEVSSLTEQLAKLEREYEERLAETMRRHEAAEQQYAEECNRLNRALAEKELLLGAVEQRLTGVGFAEAEEPELESMLAIERSAPAEERAAAAQAPADTSAADTVLIFDEGDLVESAAKKLAEFGYASCALRPGPNLPDEIVKRQAACAAINLAQPEAWVALRQLRNGSGGTPLVAYALTPGTPRGFWFGSVSFVPLPVESGALAELLNRLAPKVRRVIAMSNDIDVMSEVRTQLNEARISTAVVLDGRQALDLVPTIRPEAAVLHLSPSCADVFRAIAGLRSTEITRDIPLLFLLDSTPDQREEAFLNAGVRMLTSRGMLKPEELGESLATALEASQSAFAG
jgi:hypothetical protein